MKPNNEQLKDCPCPDGYEILTREWLTARMEIPVDALYRFSRKKSPDSNDGWDNLPPRFDCQLEDVDLDRWEFVAPIGTMERSPTPPPPDPLGVAAVTLSDRFEETLAAIEKSHTCDGEGCEVCEILAEADTKPATPTREPAEGATSEPIHTEGPWIVEPDTTTPGLHCIWTDEHGALSVLVARTCFAPASEANAKLIAEAPFLRTALAEAEARLAEADASFKDTLHRNAVSTRAAIDKLVAQLSEKTAENERLAALVGKMQTRVRGEVSESCVFCSSLTGTGHVQECPMCRLCDLESNSDTLKAQLTAAQAQIAAMWPKASEEEAKLGWHWNFDFMEAVRDKMQLDIDDGASLEAIDSILTVLHALSPSCGAELLAELKAKQELFDQLSETNRAHLAAVKTGLSIIADLKVANADLTARNAKLEGDAVELDVWQPIINIIDWTAENEHALNYNKDFSVTIQIDEYRKVEGARQSLDSAQEGRGA